MMHVDGHVYPSSETPLTLHAVFKDGTTAVGESKIAIDRKTIDRVYVCNTNDKMKPKRLESRFSNYGRRHGRFGTRKFIHQYPSKFSDTRNRRSNAQDNC